MRKPLCAAIAALLIALMIAPTAGAAYVDDGNLWTLTVDGVSVRVAADPAVDLALTARLDMGATQDLARQLVHLALTNGEINVLDFTQALEGGSQYWYLFNQNTRPSHVLKASAEASASNGIPYRFNFMAGTGSGDAFKWLEDPDKAAEMAARAGALLEEKLAMKLLGEEDLELLDTTIRAPHLSATIEGKKLYQLLDSLAALDEDLYKSLQEAASYMDYDVSDQPKAKKDEDVGVGPIEKMMAESEDQYSATVQTWMTEKRDGRITLSVTYTPKVGSPSAVYVVLDTLSDAAGRRAELTAYTDNERDTEAGGDGTLTWTMDDHSAEGVRTIAHTLKVVTNGELNDSVFSASLNAVLTDAKDDKPKHDAVTVEVNYQEGPMGGGGATIQYDQDEIPDGEGFRYEGAFRGELYIGQASMGELIFNTHISSTPMPDQSLIPGGGVPVVDITPDTGSTDTGAVDPNYYEKYGKYINEITAVMESTGQLFTDAIAKLMPAEQVGQASG